MAIDLDKLEQKFRQFFDKETEESFNEWLASKIKVEPSPEQDAVRFAEWVEDNGWWSDYWLLTDGSETKEKFWNNDSANPKNLTTEMLYQLFKIKINNNE